MNNATFIRPRTVEEAIRARHSVRAFLDEPVPFEQVHRILDLARRAPSGSNIQPWKVRVLTGEAKRRLSEAVLGDIKAAVDKPPRADWNYYPLEWREPYLSRRRESGWGLYRLAGIARGNKAASKEFSLRNFEFFGAPVGMIFTLDRDMETGAWLDLGIFLGELVLAAVSFGFSTCLQQSWANVHATVRREVGVGENEFVICGMALGFEDRDAPENTLATDRMAVDEFATFAGFEK